MLKHSYGANRKTLLVFAVMVSFTVIMTGFSRAADFRKNPYLVLSGVNSGVRLLWQTDATPAHAMAEWGQELPLAHNSGNLTESGTGTDAHQFAFDITDSEPATCYKYRVTVDSAVFTGSFTTAPGNQDTSVTVYGYGDTRSQPSIHNSVMGALLADVNSDPFNRQTLLLHSGDWVYAGDSEEDWDNQYFNRDYPDTTGLLSRLAVMGCRGNHEQNGQIYKKYWPYPYRNPDGFYYAFDYGPLHVTVVDQYVSFSPGSAQYTWIESDLANTRKPWKLVLLHQPAWSAGGGHDNDQATQDYLCPLFEKYKVALVQEGHNHYYARNRVNGIQYLTAGGGGAPLHAPDLASPNIVTAIQAYHFVRFDITAEKMAVTVKGTEGGTIDAFEISRKGLECPSIGSGVKAGDLAVTALDELSGLAASRKNPGIFWAHNDYPGSHPQDANTIYAITPAGTLIARYIISAAPGARDPEDMAVGPGPLNGNENPAAGNYIFWGDIGDNSSQYSEIWVKRIPEPAVVPGPVIPDVTLGPENGVDVIRLKYPDGAGVPSHKDAEVLMVDPLTGDIYIVTKRMVPNAVYRAPYPQSTSGTTTLEYVTALPATASLAWITAGDISSDGSMVILRNSGIADYVSFWYRTPGENMGFLLSREPCSRTIRSESQGEAICFSPLGDSFYTTSETSNFPEPIWNYTVGWDFSGNDIDLIRTGSVWRYRDDGSDQGSAWQETAFDDSSWLSGPSELGYGDGDEATAVGYGPDAGNKHVTTYFRHSFDLDNPSFDKLLLRLKSDDGAIVFVNGTQVLESRMPWWPVSYDTLANSPAVSGIDELLFLGTEINPGLLVNGKNTVAVEIHQQSVTSSDITMDLELIGRTVLNLPDASTLPASSVTPTSAVLGGTVDPRSLETQVLFECVTTGDYSSVTTSAQSPLNGTGSQSISRTLSGLSPETTYLFRVRAKNRNGTRHGQTLTFTTPSAGLDQVYVNKTNGTCGGRSPCYQSIQQAINACGPECTVRISGGPYTEDLLLDAMKTVSISGCWNDSFSGQIPNTTVIRSPVVRQGELILSEITVLP
ncbi:MAG: metallophosphoesterase [Pseudomonadota bacterium]